MAIAIYILKITHLQPYNIDDQPGKICDSVCISVSDNGEVICADGAFELQAGVTYQFLIRLDGNK